MARAGPCKAESKACFFEKKQQKTFGQAVADSPAPRAQGNKPSWFFIQKITACLASFITSGAPQRDLCYASRHVTHWQQPQREPGFPENRRVQRLKGPLAFGLRVWVSVCLALFIAYWLQLENPFWAGTSAGIVCQPSLGASLRKANFRLIGTLLGAVVVVLLMAAFPQSRAGFFLVLATWCGLCGFAATVLQNFASYAAALAGYTAVIIAADAISHPNDVFLLAVARGTEISLGIVCAGVVLVLTGRGTARERAATTIADIARQTGLGLRGSCEHPGDDSTATRSALIGRTSALATLLDETVGESPDLRVHSNALSAAVDGLFAALSGWRMVANHLETAPPAQAASDVAPLLAALPPGSAIVVTARSLPAETRDRCRDAARALGQVPVQTSGSELVQVGVTDALRGLAAALNGVALLVEPARAEDLPGIPALRLPDLLPALINGLRAFLIILVTALWWIVSAWPSGTSALLFAAIVVLLLSPRGESAVRSAWLFLGGALITSVLAGIVNFAVLPNREGFVSLALVMGVVIVPLAALSAGAWKQSFFVAASTNFTPLLAPANQPTFDTASFYNATVAIVVGVGVGALAIALLPQLSPEHRAERLRLLTLRDLRRLATRRRPPSLLGWEELMYGRLAALPEGSTPLAHAEITAALFVGGAVLRLRLWAAEFGRIPALQTLLAALGAGQLDAARRALLAADQAFAAGEAQSQDVRPARAALLALQEALTRHADYFGRGQHP